MPIGNMPYKRAAPDRDPLPQPLRIGTVPADPRGGFGDDPEFFLYGQPSGQLFSTKDGPLSNQWFDPTQEGA